jgi:hypothetical protein
MTEIKAKSDIEKVVKSLKGNHFKVEYVERAADAVPIILNAIPADASIEMAGSVSVSQLGLLDLLRERGNKGLEPPKPEQFSFEEMRKNRRDVLLVSSNAVTLDGKLVNLDGMGNRVASMFFGVKQVVLLIGANKIVRDLDEALERVQKTIAPYHAKNLGVNTPCAATGECTDCNSPQRICNITTILSKKPPTVDFLIVLVGEDLGLGWDPEWPEERIEKITSAYQIEIEKFRAKMGPPPRR